MHSHIHALIYFVRLLHYARLAHYTRLAHYARLGSMRFLGTMLLMLLFSMLQFVGIKPASAALMAKESRYSSADFIRYIGQAGMWGELDPAADPRYGGVKVTDPVPPDAITTKAQTSVFYRLKPGIVMVPRMNRTPKPKSVYRCFTRAPGIGHCREV